MSCVVQIWFDRTDDLPAGVRPPFTLVETNLPDFGAVTDAVAANRLIAGNVLFTVPTDTKGERDVVGRQPLVFRGEAVMRMALPTWRFFEADDGEG